MLTRRTLSLHSTAIFSLMQLLFLRLASSRLHSLRLQETQTSWSSLTLRLATLATSLFSASVALRHTVQSFRALLVLSTTFPVVAPLTILLVLLQLLLFKLRWQTTTSLSALLTWYTKPVSKEAGLFFSWRHLCLKLFLFLTALLPLQLTPWARSS